MPKTLKIRNAKKEIGRKLEGKLDKKGMKNTKPAKQLC